MMVRAFVALAALIALLAAPAQGFAQQTPFAPFAETPSDVIQAARKGKARKSAPRRAPQRRAPARSAVMDTDVPNPAGGDGPPGEVYEPAARLIVLRHLRTGERLSVVYRLGDSYLPDAMRALNWFFRDFHCRVETEMDPALIDLLWELQHELQPRGAIQVVSAYRSEGYNASLLRAGRAVDPDSQHMRGRAVDVLFPGVPLDRLREAAERRGIGGVGKYPFAGPPFVHLDTGPVRAWEEGRGAKPEGWARRVKYDCSLRMEDVIAQRGYESVIAALPDGASAALASRKLSGGLVPDLLPPGLGAAPAAPDSGGDRASPPNAISSLLPSSNGTGQFLVRSLLEGLGIRRTYSLSPGLAPGIDASPGGLASGLASKPARSVNSTPF